MHELRERSKGIPDEHIVCLIGDMITEEALPTYMSMLNTLDGTRDETGASDTPWANWTRKWTAEENRHGDAMNKCVPPPHRRRRRQSEACVPEGGRLQKLSAASCTW